MNFTNYYTFHITRHITRKPNNRLANQPTFLYNIYTYAHTRVYIVWKKVGWLARLAEWGE